MNNMKTSQFLAYGVVFAVISAPFFLMDDNAKERGQFMLNRVDSNINSVLHVANDSLDTN